VQQRRFLEATTSGQPLGHPAKIIRTEVGVAELGRRRSPTGATDMPAIAVPATTTIFHCLVFWFPSALPL
jgi:hypothetical protein